MNELKDRIEKVYQDSHRDASAVVRYGGIAKIANEQKQFLGTNFGSSGNAIHTTDTEYNHSVLGRTTLKTLHGPGGMPKHHELHFEKDGKKFRYIGDNITEIHDAASGDYDGLGPTKEMT